MSATATSLLPPVSAINGRSLTSSRWIMDAVGVTPALSPPAALPRAVRASTKRGVDCVVGRKRRSALVEVRAARSPPFLRCMDRSSARLAVDCGSRRCSLSRGGAASAGRRRARWASGSDVPAREPSGRRPVGRWRFELTQPREGTGGPFLGLAVQLDVDELVVEGDPVADRLDLTLGLAVGPGDVVARA